MSGDFGELAYAIAVLILSAVAGIAGHFKKKRRQTETEKQVQPRSAASTSRTSPEPTKKAEFPTSPAELMEMILKRTGRGSETGEAGAPKVEPPLRPARARSSGRRQPAHPVARAPQQASPAKTPKPQRAGARSLGALHQDQVTIDSVEHARHISDGAQEVGRLAEEHTGLLQHRLKERKHAWGKGVASSRKRSSRSRYTPSDLRQAIIMNEILGKPVALRDT